MEKMLHLDELPGNRVHHCLFSLQDQRRLRRLDPGGGDVLRLTDLGVSARIGRCRAASLKPTAGSRTDVSVAVSGFFIKDRAPDPGR